jgi:hypothetical protein
MAGQFGAIAKYPTLRDVLRKIYRLHLQCRALAADCDISVCRFPKAVRIRICFGNQTFLPIKDPTLCFNIL